ncbi:hypothetical protein BWO91_16990 [Plantibacter flavus]|nr:hypothetical protein BWO91_16990 [Plantibacter flavus]
MTKAGPSVGAEDSTPEEVAEVKAELSQLQDLVKNLRFDEIKNGGWFAKLLTVSLGVYTEKVDWAYFQEKYKGVPPDAIVGQRVKLAARYAAIEGGLTATAYTGVLIATLGTAGAASPVTVPAAVGTVAVDLAYISQLQIRTAYDISVLYNVPLDLEDPEDLWKLIRVAFTIKSGEIAREGAIVMVPAIMRPLIKKFFSGPVLAATKGLPFVGKFLLQRNLIKIGIPVIGIPFAVGMNYWTTMVAGQHAQKIFRNEGRVIEIADRLLSKSKHPQLLLWVTWLVINSDGKNTDDETLLLRHLLRLAKELHEIEDEKLARVVDIDPSEVWSLIAGEMGDLEDIVAAAEVVAAVDGEINAKERTLIAELRRRCAREAT